MISETQVERILGRFAELEHLLAQGGGGDTFVKLSKEYAELTPVATCARQVKKLWKERDSLEELLADSKADPEMRALAEEELQDLRERLPEAERTLQLQLLPRDAADEKGAILEIRAGTGGDEAALFGADLLRMYQRYAEARGWGLEVLNLHETDLGGIKEAIVLVRGRGVFARLKFESGVHRVQRVPETEAGGRIHTSAATVAVLPEAEDFDVDVEEKDLRIDVFRSQGAGGQHVNTTDSAVRITHLPSGLVVACQDEKSQHKNRAKAMKILRARLYEQERSSREQARAEQRRSQVGSGDRSERVRTYNFPQGRVTDHRVNLTLYKLEQVVREGALDEIVEALMAQDEAERLAAMESAA